MRKDSRQIFHIAGSGACRNDGSGSWFAFAIPGTGVESIHVWSGLTREVATYRAFVAVLKYMKPGTGARILTDLRELPAHFGRTFGVKDLPLNRLMGKARKLVEEKELYVKLEWAPRHCILAATYIPRNEPEEYSRLI